ncbi:MAG: sigma-54-dependent Fis family transcriptional regulator [Candidatus Goldbacteria bacterium]|nr:sigma-54-dependent Fis family transcriptional regulator [Candidatus Goldiibacteriota bacterium]
MTKNLIIVAHKDVYYVAAALLYKAVKQSDIYFTSADTFAQDLSKFKNTDYENIYVTGVRLKNDFANELKEVLSLLYQEKKKIKIYVIKDRFEINEPDAKFFTNYLMKPDDDKKGECLIDVINEIEKPQKDDYLRLKNIFNFLELKNSGRKIKEEGNSAISDIVNYMEYTINMHWKWHVGNDDDLREMIIKLANNLVSDEDIKIAKKYDTDDRYMLTGSSKIMSELRKKIELISKHQNVPVLIYGETGVGKEIVARMLHDGSDRREKTFLPVNCAGIPPNLMEDMLFGHKKGAFTDAKDDRKGMFEAADGGTIFLDEITEMSMDVQAKLLRVLEDFCFIPLGASNTVKVDVRIIAATNASVNEKIKEKKFRQDLYYRISGAELYVPSLRERKEDIKEIANVIFYRLHKEQGYKRHILTKKEINILESYYWPGNIRQLQKFLIRCLIFNAKDAGFKKVLDEIGADDKGIKDAFFNNNDVITLKEAEKMAIKQALQTYNGNKTLTANGLGIALNTLKSKMKEYGINDENGK